MRHRVGETGPSADRKAAKLTAETTACSGKQRQALLLFLKSFLQMELIVIDRF